MCGYNYQGCRAAVPLIVTVSLLLLSPITGADTVYKYVDALGNVTYSNIPTDNLTNRQEVSIPPAPKAEDVQHTLDNQQNLEQELVRMQEARILKQTELAQQREAAAQALMQARINLEAAQQHRDEDWQHIKGGKRFLKESYFARINAAMEELRAAEQAATMAR